MNLHQLNTFITVYSLKSFTRAAQELGLSQPTISEQIKNLEDHIGFKLFDRLGRTVVPTKEAEILFPRVVEILQQVKNLKDYVAEETSKVEGLIRFGASTIPGTYILPVLASRFRQLYPDVRFEIEISDSEVITEKVKNHDLLLGFTGAIMDEDKVDARPFYSERLVLACSADFMEKDRVSPKELLSMPFVLREKGSGTRKTMERFLNSKGISIKDLNVIAVLGSTDAVKEALRSSLGVSIISDIAIREELKRGVLKEIRIRGFNIKRNFYIITFKNRTLPLQYRRFFEFVLQKERRL